MLEELRSIHNSVVNSCNYEKKRYLYQKINWDNRAICISGSRGVGKTTLMLQYYKQKYDSPEKCLYISGDNITVISNGLYKIVQEHFKYGGEAVMIDEIHKYPNWSQELKNSIDTYNNKKFIISGSSSQDLKKAKYDLSRRIVYYELKGFSFREFLLFSGNIDLPVLKLEDLLIHHTELSNEIISGISVLKEFSNYINYGYYPFFLEGIPEYYQKVLNCIEKVIYDDIAVIFNVNQSKIPVLKKILWLISISNSFEPNITGMSSDLGISKEYVYNYLEFLEYAGILSTVRYAGSGAKYIRKPGKIYFENTNLPVAINGSIKKESQTGMLRETFFLNQFNHMYGVALHKRCDFLLSGKYPVEIGGPSKDGKRINDLPDAFLAVDGIEIGAGNRIPLYLFGFLY